MPNWFWPSNSTNGWITSSQIATTSTAGWINNFVQVWPSQTATTTGTSGIDLQNLYQQQLISQHMQAQAARHQVQLQHFQYEMARQLYVPSAPAIITHQEQERRDRELYERAVREHDQQEQDRLLRQIAQHQRLAADERRLVEERAEAARAEQERRTIAKARARELLVEHLTPQQRETFDANGWFVVEGGKSKTQYRIRALESMVANVDVLRGHDAKVTHRLCAHVRVGTVPLGDQLLAQKIMLELAEDDFLRTANRHAA